MKSLMSVVTQQGKLFKTSGLLEMENWALQASNDKKATLSAFELLSIIVET